MPTDDTAETRDAAQRYFQAWTSRDTDSTRSLLADDFRFTAGDMHVEGREAFLQAGAFPTDAVTTMLDEAYEGDTGFQLYESTRGDRAIVVAERLKIRGGVVVESLFVTDMTAFMRFMAPAGPDRSP